VALSEGSPLPAPCDATSPVRARKVVSPWIRRCGHGPVVVSFQSFCGNPKECDVTIDIVQLLNVFRT
jgi:hypothetical protein